MDRFPRLPWNGLGGRQYGGRGDFLSRCHEPRRKCRLPRFTIHRSREERHLFVFLRQKEHEVWFLDATSFANHWNSARDYGFAGLMLSRMGGKTPPSGKSSRKRARPQLRTSRKPSPTWKRSPRSATAKLSASIQRQQMDADSFQMPRMALFRVNI